MGKIPEFPAQTPKLSGAGSGEGGKQQSGGQTGPGNEGRSHQGGGGKEGDGGEHGAKADIHRKAFPKGGRPEQSLQALPTSGKQKKEGASKHGRNVEKQKGGGFDREKHDARLAALPQAGEREVGDGDQAGVRRASTSARESWSGISGAKLRSKWATTPSTPAASKLKRRRMQRTRKGLKL